MLYLIITIQLIVIIVLILTVVRVSYNNRYWQNQAEAWAKSNDAFHDEWEGRQ